MQMKRIFTIIAVLALCRFSVAGKAGNVEIKADSEKITYVGRVLHQENGDVSFDWSGVTVRVRFKGTGLAMSYNDTRANYFNVWVDEAPSAKQQQVIKTKGDGTVVLAEGLRNGEHEVVFQKRTEGEQGTVTIHGFTTDGSFLQAGAPAQRLIEVIGDSYTCGYGTESNHANDPFLAETENCNLTYAAIAGRYFGADIRLISHSGCGVVRNYDDGKTPYMPERFLQTFDMSGDHPWNGDGRIPDIVIIYLGTNDFSCSKQPSLESWIAGCGGLLDSIRSSYGPDVPILMVASRANDLLGDYVRSVVQWRHDPKLAWTSIQSNIHDNVTELGASWHPNYAGHRKVAMAFIPYISTLTGWEMPLKPIE